MYTDISVGFGKVDSSAEDVEGCFKTSEGLYYYKVDILPDDLVISDSVGRYVPINKNYLRDLHTIVDLARVKYEEEDWLDKAIRDTLRNKRLPVLKEFPY